MDDFEMAVRIARQDKTLDWMARIINKVLEGDESAALQERLEATRV